MDTFQEPTRKVDLSLYPNRTKPESALTGLRSESYRNYHKHLFDKAEMFLDQHYVPPVHAKHLLYYLLLDSPKGLEFEADLQRHSRVPRIDDDWISQALRESLEGKKILELACRDAGFLGFLRDFGASEVHGVTESDRYVPTARRRIGSDSITESQISALTEQTVKTLAAFNPDIVLNCGLLEMNRANAPSNLKETFLRVVHSIGGLHYIVPSINGLPGLSCKDFPKIEGDEKALRCCRIPDWSDELRTQELSECALLLPPHLQGPCHVEDNGPLILGFRMRFANSLEGKTPFIQLK